MIGATIGPYRVLERVGAGGMGEVWRARDTKLGRDVALKLLPPPFVDDPERLARFEREAKTLAALNHPHIAHLHGLEESGGQRALVMELVEGPTLAERIARGAVPVDEALPLAHQLAEALEYAHEHGVVHRDLKPANIKITPDGTVKVLDFGLAKALDPAPGAGLQAPDPANSPTITSPAMTRAGVILGTAAYMSPEQARGKTVDKRADIWAFGVVLFEMLTGRTCFGGQTVTDVLAAVVRADPDWSVLPAETPWRVRDLLRRCLTKDPKQRLHDIGDARLEIEEPIRGPGAEGHGRAPASPTPSRRWAVPAWWLMVAAAGGAAVVGVLPRRAVTAPSSPIRMVLDLPPGYTLVASDPAFSPDGRLLVYAAADASGRQQLFVRTLDQLGATPLVPQPELVLSRPFVSPDGQWVGFFGERRLFKVQLEGARQPQPVANAAAKGRFATWAPDGAIVFVRDLGRELLRVPAAGGAPETLAALDTAAGEMGYAYPQVLPGNRRIIYGLLTKQGWSLAAQSLDTRAQTILIPGATVGRYIPSGHLVFAKDGGLFAAAFDAERLRITGTAAPIVPNLASWHRSSAATTPQTASCAPMEAQAL